MRVWFVKAFEKTGDQYLARWIRVDGLDDEVIREVWSMPEDDSLYGASYPITPENIDRVQPFIPERLDMDSYLWFLSEEAEGDEPG
jgi:hypothetical protein